MFPWPPSLRAAFIVLVILCPCYDVGPVLGTQPSTVPTLLLPFFRLYAVQAELDVPAVATLEFSVQHPYPLN